MSTGQPASPPPVVAAMFVRPAETEHYGISLRALRALDLPVVVGSEDPGTLAHYEGMGCTAVTVSDMAELINRTWADHHSHVLAVGDGFRAAKELVSSAVRLLEDDVRVASVSFFSNDGGYLSFPQRNEPSRRPPEGQDEESVSRLLRERGPSVPPTPILTALGPVVMLSSSSLGSVGFLEAGPERSFNAVMADFSARARDRGFVHLLDNTNFVVRHRSPLTEPSAEWPVDDLPSKDRHWFYIRHPKDLAVLASDAELSSSPISISHQLGRAKVQGLRVGVDGYDLGPHEMGTQVAVLASVEALVRIPDIREIVVLLSNPLPQYARRVLEHPKVILEHVLPPQFPELERCDVVHRMAQPNPGFSVSAWRQLGDRVVVSVLDLIAYRVGAYHDNEDTWLVYRDAIRRGVSEADAVTVISEDVRHQVELERLPIDPDRLETIPFGTGHLTGEEQMDVPAELLARGFIAHEFILCMGTDYSHKNRDLAIAAVRELRRRGWHHALVLAGPAVPYGSSRVSENWELLKSDEAFRQEVFILPEVPSAERNWLLRHASAVLYPSSAEGFGLVPYEAAQFGTPTVFVGFGPLLELAPGTPVTARDWSAPALADALEALVSDGDLAQRQVQVALRAGSAYTWSLTADRLMNLYYRVLSMPSRG